jgi:transglutaminase-like putative cysteine protease
MTVTTAVTCVLTSTALLPLFSSTRWFALAAGAVITVAATGALTRLRNVPVPVCLAASLAGLLLCLNTVFEARHSLLVFIPTPASLSRLWDLAGAGTSDAYRHLAPVPDLPGLLLLSTAGVGIIAVLADMIAVRLRSTALAGLPLLALFIVPVMMNAPYDQFTTGLAFCLGGAGYLAMLRADRRERTRARGPDTRAPGAARVGGRARVADRGGGWGAVGVASIVVALCAPLLVPGLHAGNLFSPGPRLGILSLRGASSAVFVPPDESHPSVVFTYRTTASASLERNNAQYFTQYVYDTLSDTGWQADYAQGAAPISSIPAPQGLSDLSSSQPVDTTVTVGSGLDGPGPEPAFLPLPYPATKIDAPGEWLADPDLMAYSTRNSIAGQSYWVESFAVDPSQAQLEAVPRLTTRAGLAPDFELPSSYETAALKELAERYAGGQSTEFGAANALATWLSGPQFTYTHAAVPFDDAAGLLSFLTKTRAGFCVQYAWAMTVLARLLGIPARFVTGYTAGTRLPNGSYAVKNTDAHAWTEVYFPTFGWIRFEPTPGGVGGTAAPPSYMTSSTGAPPIPAGAAPINPVTGAPTGTGGRQSASSAIVSQPRSGHSGPSRALAGGPAGTPWAALALAVIAAIALVTPAAARVTLRRWRWMRATDDASRARAAWREFLDDLADYGVGARPGEPPRRLAGRITAGLPESAGAAIWRLALAEERARFAACPSGSQHLRRDSAAARRSLASRARRGARWRARIFPASVMTALPTAANRHVHRVFSTGVDRG